MKNLEELISAVKVGELIGRKKEEPEESKVGKKVFI